MDCRANIRLAISQPADEQGLRAQSPNQRNVDRGGYDSSIDGSLGEILLMSPLSTPDPTDILELTAEMG